MKREAIESRLARQLPNLIQVEDWPGGGFLVWTPLIRPDGDVISLLVREIDGRLQIGDGGDSVGWLWVQDAHPEMPPLVRKEIDFACRQLGVEFLHGEVQACCDDPERLAEVIMLVALAAARVSDLYLVQRQLLVNAPTSVA